MSQKPLSFFPSFSNFVEVLRWRALHQPDREAYTFLLDGETESVCLTYKQVDQSAHNIAALLQQYRVRAGERALLLFPPGLAYIAAFWGCLYANVVAVPAYPPRQNRHLARIEMIAADAEARIALTNSQSLSTFKQWLSQNPGLNDLPWLSTDHLDETTSEARLEDNISGKTTALIQYTSGSTGTPRGVILTHDNLLYNSSLIRQCLDPTLSSRGISWLPPYHDLGLIGGILQPIYSGFPITLMSPTAFLQRPLRWLQAISNTKGTISGGPNFAYDLCTRKFSLEQCENLDLSSWEVAFSGAEPINPETLESFTKTYEPFGFKREVFTPCYGLAEATLVVSCGKKSAIPMTHTFDEVKLEQNQVTEYLTEGNRGQTLVGCGRTFETQKIRIVDPSSQTKSSPDHVGEIWISGPSIAEGYWNCPDETKNAFHAYIADTGEGPFLRTGDLGFLFRDELFITGRLKDLIVIRGHNHYPQDIEKTVELCHRIMRRGCSAAFSINVEREEQLVVVQEVERHHRLEDLHNAIALVRQVVAEQHQLQVYAVVLIKSGSIPKTSSGKIQRQACRAAFLAGSLDILESNIVEISTDNWIQEEHFTHEILFAVEETKRHELLVSYLRKQVAQALQRNPLQINPDHPLSALGLNSLAAIQLKYSLETSLKVMPSMTSLLQMSIDQLALHILAELAASPTDQLPMLVPSREALSEYPISFGQRALWFLHQLAPESSAYNIAQAVHISGELDSTALETAFQALVDRHPTLRTTFAVSKGNPVQRIHRFEKVFFQQEDASGWDETMLHTRMQEKAYYPFNLEHGPLLKIYLFRRALHDHILLLVVHHIVADFWSLAIMTQELSWLYQGEKTTTKVALDPVEVQYTDYVLWQEKMLASSQGESLWSYWHKQLGDELPLLNLPTDQPRPPIQTYRGASDHIKLSKTLTERLKKLSSTYETTLFTTLLAAFQVLLYRYTGQEDIAIGSPTAGRTQAALAGVVGYFVNPVVLRANLTGNPTFETFLLQMRRTVLDAFEHQDYPFALLAERLQQVRDPSRSPIFQAMFALQNAPILQGQDLTGFALGQTQAQITLEGLPMEVIALAQQTSQFDLMLAVVEMDEELHASLQYNTDLFKATTIRRMLKHLQMLLEGIATHPEHRLHALPLLTKTEQQLLAQPCIAPDSYTEDQAVDKLFEAQVEQAPDATAVVFQEEHLSYQELNRRANQMARRLRKLGIGPEALVGIYVERCLEMIIGMLGILKSGAAFVPLDVTYPQERLSFMIHDAGLSALVTQKQLASKLKGEKADIVYLDHTSEAINEKNEVSPNVKHLSGNLAYVMYTSGSTGLPKGVMIQHCNLVNFFKGMDHCLGYTPSKDVLLAVTGVSFDISILELLWTLTRGIRVIILSEQAITTTSSVTKTLKADKDMEFSLFYFASDESGATTGKYRLLMEGAKFADQHGFTAVWTPERHFHAFGGLYPNPSVTSAALATITERIRLRGGSVVMPLHDPIRVAEEWSVVDNLSNGRVGIAFASGWQTDDFVFFPENYASRKEVMFKGIETVQKLWRGEAITVRGGANHQLEVRTLPCPIQVELPIWITAAGSPETFVNAGKIGAGILTHLLGQTIEEMAEKIKLYRQALEQHGHRPEDGHVTLMLHTFIGNDKEAVRERVRKPFTNYLRSSVDLIANLIRSLNLPLDLKTMSEKDLNDLLAFAFDRYFETSALFGTLETCHEMIGKLKGIGVEEIACLIDFGVDENAVLDSLHFLNELKEYCSGPTHSVDYSLAAQAFRHSPTLMQCTPSLMRVLTLSPDAMDALKSLRILMLGGEALPAFLSKQIKSSLPCKLINMYGPTETTIWSATYEVTDTSDTVPIGYPIINTQFCVLDRYLQLVPPGVPGELYIGGNGLARGYFNHPEITAERFIPNPFSQIPGGRLYKTGDLVCYLLDGTIEYLGRIDYQVKIRGHRIELEEIEAVLDQHPFVREAIVLVRGDTLDDKRLVAYIVPGEAPLFNETQRSSIIKELKNFSKGKLPSYMIPSNFVLLDFFPLTPNGKIDRKALPTIQAFRSEIAGSYVEPSNQIERTLAKIWRDVLNIEHVGIEDNFFDLGGHSLLVAQVHSQIKQMFRQDLPLVKLLEYPTIGSLARYLSQNEGEQPPLQVSQDRVQKQLEALKRQRKRAKSD